ncbi:hypothetical protein [Pantoea sp. FN0307]|uniref:hypothetical protein n=1 Tax=Pantoea sp. FN0307 TaxID=3418560 RepID=UPI003CF4A206
MDKFRAESQKITSYGMFLKEPPRPPSRGGNTGALHSHLLEIEGEKFSFLALGSQKWIFKSDIVFFEYKIENEYKNIIKDTIVIIDRNDNVVFKITELLRRNSVLLLQDTPVAEERKKIDSSANAHVDSIRKGDATIVNELGHLLCRNKSYLPI